MRRYLYHVDGFDDKSKVFVFGSNLAGRHGKGAALYAYHNRGARYGVGAGFVGNSYAIPTKNSNLVRLPIAEIKEYVDDFKYYASEMPELRFFVTRIGCGLAGYSDADIAPLFRGAPNNCDFPLEWEFFLED